MILFISDTCLFWQTKFIKVFAARASIANSHKERIPKNPQHFYFVFIAPKAGQLIMHDAKQQPAAAFCPFNLRQMWPLFAENSRPPQLQRSAVTSKSKRAGTTFCGLLSRVV